MVEMHYYAIRHDRKDTTLLLNFFRQKNAHGQEEPVASRLRNSEKIKLGEQHPGRPEMERKAAKTYRQSVRKI